MLDICLSRSMERTKGEGRAKHDDTLSLTAEEEKIHGSIDVPKVHGRGVGDDFRAYDDDWEDVDDDCD
ncbi:hypothetical protein V3C99_005544 [Haemonchus contortus]|uniref:CHZ domain-containing protein n=1 Tax=Haemonchus placei TaxID=6290 RepID=A0A0N4WPJ3_HAEPC|nr:unnamed protein product [Haemonchus placei]